MKLLAGFEGCSEYRGGMLSIGNFDGVHRGHQQMFASLVSHARELDVPAIVLTFDPHPIEILRPGEVPPRLTTNERKIELIEQCGVDVLITYPTDLRLLNLSPQDFFEAVVLGELDARGLVEGPNFFFGRNRAGDVKVLHQLCQQFGRLLDVVPPVFVGTQMVSSSTVRALIVEGDVTQANDLLGHRYGLRGLVTKGAVRGRTLGFPTANVTHVATVLPRDGVYAGVAYHAGESWPAAINLGPNPTFGERRRKLETHLLGFTGDLYDQMLDIEFVSRLRDTQTFPNVDALKAQLAGDIRHVRQIVSGL
jgi:riboflavin kinase/FMN adenylyltransferase